MIALYSPDVPPQPGGVSDQTLALARALAAMGASPVVLALHGDPTAFAPIPCRVGIDPLEAPEAARVLGASSLLVQYVPFLYAHRGVAPALFRLPAAVRRAGLHWGVFVHEPFVPFTRLAWLVTGIPQRLQFRVLVRAADRVYAAAPRFADLARRWGAAAESVALVPVGATIPVSSLTRAEARARLGLGDDRIAIGIFSPAASGFAHAWIAAAAHRLSTAQGVTWVRFGRGSARDLPGYPRGPNVITVGETEAGTVAATMRALDVAAQPYTDGLTLRRTGAMLALASGVPVVSSQGHLFDPALSALAACEPTPDAFADRLASLAADPSARRDLAARTAGYAEHASTEALARRIAADFPHAEVRP